MTRICADEVRAEWEEICGLPRRLSRELAGLFWREQPIVGAYVMALARDLGTEALALGTRVVLTIDRLYERALSHKPVRVNEEQMERADDALAQSASELVGAEPELAIRRLLNQREFVEPDVPMGLIQLIIEEGDAVDSAGVAGFMIAKTVALAYEYANDMQLEPTKLGSFAEVIERQTGRPFPKIGRNDPCACGSGKQFKKCHGDTSLQNFEMPQLSHTEQLFWDYMDIVGAAMDFFRELRKEPAGKRHWEAFERFGAEFNVGEEGGLFDSIQLGYFLFDLPLPRTRVTVGERFLQSKGDELSTQQKDGLRHLINSHLGFYEYLGLSADVPKKELRDLVTGQLWLASAADDPTGEHDSPGDIMIVRLVGPVDDALMAGMPVLLAPAAKNLLEGIGQKILQSSEAAGENLDENNRTAMKAAVPLVAEFLMATGLLSAEDDEDLDDDFEDDDELDEDDFDPDLDDDDEED